MLMLGRDCSKYIYCFMFFLVYFEYFIKSFLLYIILRCEIEM